jgi:hypothetical protein
VKKSLPRLAKFNLLVLRNSKTEKNHKNAEVRYTAGTRNDPTARNVRTPMSVQEEIDRLRDAPTHGVGRRLAALAR